ncbi:MAG: alanine racemase [Tepidiforma sp.]|nr:MAG: alanine racemase [Tepidiforma sp.]
MRLDEIDTPALLLDLDAVEDNIATMQHLLEGTGVRLRPHFKTPKCPHVARMQLEAGAIGITVAKLGEAEVLADAGLGPLLVANQVVGAPKLARLVSLLRRGVDITVAVESEYHVRELAAAARGGGVRAAAVIEVDAGMRRCGTANPAVTVRLARMLMDEGIEFRGIMGYEGHMYGQPEAAARERLIREALDVVRQHVEALAEAGMPPSIVSTSGTASVPIAAGAGFVTELQAGTYVFNDLHNEAFIPGRFRFALTLLTTITSVKERYAVADCGLKSLTNEFGAPVSPDGRLRASRLSEEHAIIVGDGVSGLRPGDRVELIPSHGDTTLNLHDVYYVRRGGEVVDTWPIEAARRFR